MLVKICCMQNEAEVHVASEAGATHVGLVGPMPSGVGPITDEAIAAIASSAPESVTTVLLTSRTRPSDIVDHVLTTGVDAVQIVRAVPESTRLAIRQALPGVAILQVVHVEGAAALAEAREAAKGADYLLLDSGRPSADVAELGGTGRVHDWSVSAEIVRRAPVPTFLAGGLKPGNVAQAVAAVRPAGVDLCSGIRGADDGLMQDRLESFMEAVGRA